MGVDEVNESEGWVRLATPQYMGDEDTKTTVKLADIASVKVTDMKF